MGISIAVAAGWITVVPVIVSAIHGLALLIAGGRGGSERNVHAFAVASFAFLSAVGVALRSVRP